MTQSNLLKYIELFEIESLIDVALKEDIGAGDLTTIGALYDPQSEKLSDSSGTGELLAKQKGIMAGSQIFEMVFKKIDSSCRIEFLCEDGHEFRDGETLAEFKGSLSCALTAERVALNFLGHLSGIATLTAVCVGKVSHSKIKIRDTRKTTPGLRVLEKYAVTCGGGCNHRKSLDSMALIKENHIDAAGSISKAISNLREFIRSQAFKGRFAGDVEKTLAEIEVEVSTEEHIREALSQGAKNLLIDNQNPSRLREMVSLARSIAPEVTIEASGNISLTNIDQYALSGVDYLSIGSLTHSAPVSDFSFLISR
ncbi:MAG: carboxylating nicotinate-nucleotide diphosphorylase [candidate division Zixibacteria bacterium]|nr:carboxylating nicotinate-nucleotide diphosphorylase [candidate division Zixibacteria bacterium]